MTMDVHRRCVDTSPVYLGGGDTGAHSPSSDSSSSPATTQPSKPQGKRSFDVAFLMAPDDMAKKRQQRQELKQQLRLVTTASLMPGYSPPPVQEFLLRQPLDERQGGDIPPLGLLMPSAKHYAEEDRREGEERSQFAKSAFTKVSTAGRVELTVVPPPVAAASPSSSTVSGGAVSPDICYRDSRISPPPVHRSPPSQYFPPAKPVQYFNGKTPPYLYQGPPIGGPREKTAGSPNQEQPGFQNPYVNKVQEEKGTTSKGKLYPTDVLPYGGLAVPYPFAGGFAPGGGGGSGSAHTLLTAAANVTAAAAAAAALLPPSLAALTLPAQNVCAKCNVSFRMTSDLVYHMRSQHKNDALLGESARRRREQDKLRCPVCNESFRERHHLTRHMTAHQDKEGDSVDEEDDAPRRRHQPAPAHK